MSVVKTNEVNGNINIDGHNVSNDNDCDEDGHDQDDCNLDDDFNEDGHDDYDDDTNNDGDGYEEAGDSG